MPKSNRAAQRPKTQSDSARTKIGKYCAIVSLLIVIVFFAAIRWRLRSMPLERDEGEYAYVGQLLLHGIPPYKLAYTMKLPGTHAAYALLMAVFGQTQAGIHIGLILVNAATVLLVYLLALRLSGRLAAIAASASYAVLSTSFSVLGLAAHATHFVVICAMAGILVLLKAVETERLWQFLVSGILMGLAFLMKQPGMAFAVFGGLYLLKSQLSPPVPWATAARKAGCYGLGVAMPFALTCLILAVSGVFKNFWFWVFTYAGQYTSEEGFASGLRFFKINFPRSVGSATGMWIIAGVGLTAFFWNRESRRNAVLIGGLLVFSFLAVCPGFYFRPHYFIQMLPAIALLVGTAVRSATQSLEGRGGFTLAAIPSLVFLGALTYAVVDQRAFLFEDKPLQVCEERYGINPFPEALVVAQDLAVHSSTSDRIAVLGSEPEIYFYARRLSATGIIYVYGLMEPQKYSLDMQKQMINEIEAARPQYLVFVNNRFSWLPRAGSQEALSMTRWIDTLLRGYELIGIAERVDDHIENHWGDDARSYKVKSNYALDVFKRRMNN
jgi:hypothetical protein